MAIMLVRASYTSEGFKGLVEQPHNRRDAVADAWLKVDCTLRDLFYSSSQSGWVMIVEGDPDKLVEAEFSVLASGAIASYTAELLHTPETVFAATQRVNESAGKIYDAPNRDEIDRMLLDE